MSDFEPQENDFSAPTWTDKQWIPHFLAEFLGTFAIVFFGCGAIIISGWGDTGPLLVSLAFGLIVAVMINALGHISGAHFNPAVTLAMLAKDRIDFQLASVYWVAQFLGSICASAILFLVSRVVPGSNPNTATEYLTYASTRGWLKGWPAAVLEAILTFFLMLVISSASRDRRFPRHMEGWTIGAFVGLSSMFAGSVTGNSLNPARSLGPALFGTGEVKNVLWIYFVGPMIGAVAAIFVYDWIAKPESD
jgi:MIP family channel proteins